MCDLDLLSGTLGLPHILLGDFLDGFRVLLGNFLRFGACIIGDIREHF